MREPLKVALLGTAGGWQRAPWDDLSYEIWGVNDLYRELLPSELARVNRWFELHGDTPLTRKRRPDDHWERLAQLTCPVYTFFDLPDVPMAQRFPLDEAISAGKDYFACTTSYQIALALSECATHIEVYGAPFTHAREAIVERPCVEWWLGLAEGRGVQTRVFHRFTIGLGQHTYRYALDDPHERADAYEFVLAHHNVTSEWLTNEETRLWGFPVTEQTPMLKPETWWRRMRELVRA